MVKDFAEWISELPHKHKIAVAGNHDLCFEDERKEEAKRLLREADVTYLEDSATLIGENHLKVWGAPWSRTFDRWAFKAEGHHAKRMWTKIHSDTDILVTHGPAHGTGDYLDGYGHIGCEELEREIGRIQPDLHIYGHVHEQHGKQAYGSWNVSLLDPDYEDVEDPFVIEMQRKTGESGG